MSTLAVESERQLLSCFDEVLDAPPSERLELVRAKFGSDEKLVRDLEQLIAAAERTDPTCLAESVDAVLEPVLADLEDHSATQAEIPSVLTQALAPRYTVLERIGRGGMASVYLAFDSSLGRHVAIKSLRPELADGISAERFEQEITIAATVDHPRIVPVYDRGNANGLLYYVMRYVGGGSLRDLLLERPQLEIRKAIDIARDVAEALDAAHAKKIVHRDIKPANILIDENGAHVADFGVARLIDAAGRERLTRSGVALGTALYMSPEQAGSAMRIDGRSDVYALACVLYEMLAGEAPFTGPTQRDIMSKHLAAAIPDLTVVRATVTRPMQQVIATALQKAPADRFASARAFIDAFERAWLAAPRDRPTSVRFLARPWRWLALTTIVAVVVVIAADLPGRTFSGRAPQSVQQFPLPVNGPLVLSGSSLDFTGKTAVLTLDARMGAFRITELAGNPVEQPTGAYREPQLTLGLFGTHAYSATVGCNSLSGSYSVTGDRITFSPRLSTLMVCPPPLDVLELQLRTAIDGTKRWRMLGSLLELLDDTGSTVALFEPAFPKKGR